MPASGSAAAVGVGVVITAVVGVLVVVGVWVGVDVGVCVWALTLCTDIAINSNIKKTAVIFCNFNIVIFPANLL